MRWQAHEQPLERGVVLADVSAAESAGLIKMSARTLKQLSVSSEEPFATSDSDLTVIEVPGSSFGFFFTPVLSYEIGRARVSSDCSPLQIWHTVVRL
jgi:hypothetical protein